MKDIENIELEVFFTTMGNDYRPSDVSQICRMPSGDIVVLCDDSERGRESYWFDCYGNHPKATLRKKTGGAL